MASLLTQSRIFSVAVQRLRKTCRQTEISWLEPWQVIARSKEKTQEFVKFTAEAFYKSYG